MTIKNKPQIYEEYKGEFSLFLEKLIQEGYEVEAYAKQLFENTVDLPEDASPEYTRQELKSNNTVFFQPSFLTTKGVFARVDVLEKLPNGTFHIYEIKSSTSIKKDKKHNHLKDACFQKYVLQECGHTVSKVSIINLNKEYIRQGEVIANELLDIIEVSGEIENLYSSVVNEINAATTFINKENINTSACSCLYKTRSNHCDSFSHFNTDIPDYSIYEIGRISAKKVIELVEDDNTAIIDIPLDFELNTKQQTQVESLKQEKPIINNLAIDKELTNLKFPLHFVDYETYASAVPKVDDMSPHKHLVFQVSIHTMKENGTLTHFEWLGKSLQLPTEMLKQMRDFTGLTGTFISWNAPFEIGRNKDMIAWLPEFASYLSHMNEHMYDLMNIFKEDYVDYRFHGSTSIKKVLPVLCPQFSYSELEVQDGTMALDTWGRMVSDPNFNEDIKQTRKNLLEYCKLDTLAMVEIYKQLILIVKS
mgnify:CR=1 FL=1